MKKLLLILLLPTVCFGGRKLTLGFQISGRTYVGSSWYNGDGSTYVQYFGHSSTGNFRSAGVAGSYLGYSQAIDEEIYPFYGGATSGNVYVKGWIKLDNNRLPSQNAMVFQIGDGVNASSGVGFQWNATGKVSLIVGGSPRESTATAPNRGIFILFKFWTSGSYTSFYIDGQTIIDSTHTAGTSWVNAAFGWYATQTGLIGEGRYVIFDDVVINDQSGSYENSAPDDSSRIYVMPPDSDVARNGWMGANGGTTALYDAIDNYMTGQNLGTSPGETNSTQIVDTTNSATDNFDVALTAINAWQGQDANDTVADNLVVRFVQAFVRHGEHDSAGAKLGSVQLISNPAAPSETGFTFGDNAHNSTHAGKHDIDYGDGTHLTISDSLSWRTALAAPIYWPSIDRNAKTVLRIGKRTATSLKVDVDAAGMIIEVGHANTAVTTTIYQDDD